MVFSGASNRCFFINDKSANKSQTRISGITFSNFFPKGKDHGGAIKINYSTSDIILEDLVFDHCFVPESYEGEPNRGANGGALYLNNFDEDMQCFIKNCRFTSCKSREGGALYVNNANASVGKEISVVNCLFANNSSATNGGAVYFRFGNKVKIENSLFDSNTASTEDLKGSGGAIYLHMNNDVNVKKSTFVGNSATQKGSVIYGNGNKEETQNIVTFENSVLVKNVVKRTNMGRFAIDADNIGTNNIYILKNSIVANNTNARNSIADMFIVNPSDKNVIQNSIVNGEYFDDATAESSKSKGKYKAYLTESQITEILKGRGIKEPSKYRK